MPGLRIVVIAVAPVSNTGSSVTHVAFGIGSKKPKWNVNAQPNYILLSPEGEMLVPVRGYDLSVDGFIDFLQSGLDVYSK